MDPTQIPGLTGWPGMFVTLFALLLYGFYTNRSVKSKVEDAKKDAEQKAEDIAKKANHDAIEAMQMHINILRERIKEAEEENIKMKHSVETIISALKTRGIHITIDGDMIHIRDNGNSTTILMKKE